MDLRSAVSTASRRLQAHDPLVPRFIERFGGKARVWHATRFSLSAGAILITAPLLAAPGSQFASLFVLTLPQTIPAAAAVTWAAIGVAATAQLAIAGRRSRRRPKFGPWFWALAVALLSLPLLVRIVVASSLESAPGMARSYAAVAAVGAAMAGMLTLATALGARRFFRMLRIWCSRREERPRDGVLGAGRALALRWLNWLVAHASTNGILRAFLALFLVIYVIGGVLLEPPATTWIPAIVYLLVLFTSVTAVLSFIASVLDRWRFPVFLTVLGAVLLWAAVFPPTHVFFTQRRLAAVDVLDPPEAARRLGIRTPVIVAASGGGMRAAVWMATVIRELQQACDTFLPSVQFVSAVSGGSLGTLYVLDTLDASRRASLLDLDKAIERARQSSLSDIAWAVAYPNLARRWFFGRAAPHHDRAWALEESWRRGWSWQSTTLDEWRVALGRKALPAVVFNAVQDTGRALLLANFRLADGAAADDFQRAVEAHDIDLLTAVRLSATYPLVTPISQAAGPGMPTNGVADGGYLDNSGLLSAALWMTDVLPVLDETVKRVVLVEITSSAEAGSPQSRGLTANSGYFQFVGPLSVLVQAQSASEAVRNEFMRWAIEEQARDRGIEAELVTFPLTGVPASWELTPTQYARIQAQTQSEPFRDAARRVRAAVCSAPES